MNNYAFIPKCREIITVQIRKNTITGVLILGVLLLVMLPVLLYLSSKSDHVTYWLIGYVSLAVVGGLFILWYRYARLYWTQIDTRDLSRIISTENPLSQQIANDTTKLTDYTYGNLLHVLAGYERLVAATEYNETGHNKKFRVSTANSPKWLRVALMPFKYFSLKFLFLAILLAQVAVGYGILPTLQELVTGHPLPSLSLHMSVREILQQIVIPKAVTIALLQAVRFMLTKIR